MLSSCSCLRALQAHGITTIGMQCLKRVQCLSLDALQAYGWTIIALTTKSMFSILVQV